MMNTKQWTKGLAALGVVSLASAVQAQDASETVMTAVSSTTLSGYVSTTAIWAPGTGNVGSPGNSFQQAAGQDGINLDVVSLSISKPLDDSEWAAGYNVQIWAGPDAVGYNPTAVNNPAAGGDFAIKQAAVDLRIPVGNGLDLKMGVFDTIIGYEAADIPSNPNYSRSYAWGIEPTQHTGLLASYQFNDMIAVAGGVANTFNAVINGRGVRAVAPAADESEKTYMGAISLTAPDSAGFLAGGSLYAGVVDGLAGNTTDSTHTYVGATLPTPIENLAVGVAWDYRFNGANATTPGSNWANVIAGYFSYGLTEQISLNYRIDYATGSNGTFYVRAADDEFQNKLLSNTLTVDYKAWENVITRLEARWDRALDGNQIHGGQVANPNRQAGADGDSNNLTLALNVVYQF